MESRGFGFGAPLLYMHTFNPPPLFLGASCPADAAEGVEGNGGGSGRELRCTLTLQVAFPFKSHGTLAHAGAAAAVGEHC